MLSCHSFGGKNTMRKDALVIASIALIVLQVTILKRKYELGLISEALKPINVTSLGVTSSKNAKFHCKLKVFEEFCFDFCQR